MKNYIIILLLLMVVQLNASVHTQPVHGHSVSNETAPIKYYAAVPVNIRGQKCSNFKVEIKPQKSITLINHSKEKYNTERYDKYLADMSEIIGRDVYEYSTANNHKYIIVHKPGILIWVTSYSDLGDLYWEDKETNYYNVYASDKAYVNKILASKPRQDEIDALCSTWYKKARDHKKNAYNKKKNAERANRTLPTKGWSDPNLEAMALKSARNKASREGWKEEMLGAYFTDEDWSIVRNKNTGVQLRREIKGVIVMKRDDGLCSFHYASFAQQFDGANYRKVYVAGIVPGQYKLSCDKVKLD